MLADYKREFIDFAIEQGVIRFGEFELKSGRISPYFFNAGQFNSGAALAILGRCYAAKIVSSGVNFDMLFGPAYKGIPLVAVTAACLQSDFGLDVPFAFNRKEEKTHGRLETFLTSTSLGQHSIGLCRAQKRTRKTYSPTTSCGSRPTN